MKNRTNNTILLTIEEYLKKCPRLEYLISSNVRDNDWCGDLRVYADTSRHDVRNFISRIPLQIQVSSPISPLDNTNGTYPEEFRADGGGIILKAKMDAESSAIFYLLFSINDEEHDLISDESWKEIPADPLEFEKEIARVAEERSDKLISDPSYNGKAEIIEDFSELQKHLSDYNDLDLQNKLNALIEYIKSFEYKGSYGWRDRFALCSLEAITLATSNLKVFNCYNLIKNCIHYLYDNELYSLAAPLIQQSYDKYKDLAANKPSEYAMFAAELLINMGEVDESLENYTKAGQEYKEAERLYRNLVVTDPDAYWGEVASTIQKSAYLHYNLNQKEEAAYEFKKELDIYKDLAKKNKELYREPLTNCLNNLAIVYGELRRYEDAEIEYNETLSNYRELAKDDSKTYTKEVARTLQNMALMHNDWNQDKSIAELKEALVIWRELSEDNPDDFMEMVAETLCDLTQILNRNDQIIEAEENVNEALTIYRELAEKNPDRYMGLAGQTLALKAEVIMRNPDRCDEARETCEEGLIILQPLAESDPGKWGDIEEQAMTTLYEIGEIDMYGDD